jgi:competence protein ComEA
MWKLFLKDYFNFTKKERTGTIIIVILILLFTLLPFAYPFLIKPEQISHTDFENEIARLQVEPRDSSRTKNYSKNFDNTLYDDNSFSKNDEPVGVLFYFDPNDASAADWKRLGVRDKTIHTIQNYLSKGGKFYKPQDIAKIWGLSPAEVQRLIQYVSIKNTRKEFSNPGQKEFARTLPAYTPKKLVPIDVNFADTSAFISLPGIGSKLAQRIISFRDKLGGFYSTDQIGETYFLPDSTFQKIKSHLVIGDASVRKININTATVDEMKMHPYLRYNIANAIFQYRAQHGNFNTTEDIKKIMLVTDDIFNKVAPYLSIQ